MIDRVASRIETHDRIILTRKYEQILGNVLDGWGTKTVTIIKLKHIDKVTVTAKPTFSPPSPGMKKVKLLKASRTPFGRIRFCT